ncbi:N-6 DNA methylase [Pedobacter psychroterrae]|uniref:site-specific DNA-methyltransferase (adenine-specific) n=1 Tax=Pedobacter psychroterrae TaxID=2530453 RepID=A0A4V2MLU0_9SPHI|nr:class I SAM-dependent methyltransferase [Pedobacter psychroterrae]TCD03207.1 class I SAM-dependent methyltransferase [Pedobacter psychroterrae]
MEIIKDGLTAQKLRGGYYTPKQIAKFLCKWAVDENTNKVLEPSCGDGNFVEEAILRFNELGISGDQLRGRIKGIELIEEESIKAKARAKTLGLNSNTIVNSDFFGYLNESDPEQYDSVIGNPPFIRYQNFPEEHRTLAIEMMERLGLQPNKLTNIWVPFLVISSSLLTPTGKLGMVIPAELFQVKYAAETRIYLSNFFERITIVTFKKLVFSDIQQEVVLLLCEKEAANAKGIRVVELNGLDDLETLDLKAVNKLSIKKLEHDSEKWTKYFLDKNEIELLRKIRKDRRVVLAKTIMDTNVGLVTGRNEFFMINKETAQKWDILPYTKKVVGRSNHFKGIDFSDQDFDNNAAANIEGYLFMPPDEDFDMLPVACQKYIKYGEEQKFHTGYKCKIRKRWYITPSIYRPDAFALRQVGDFPKLILNNTEASSTDTIHRVRFKTTIDPKFVIASFLNSLTFAFSEVTGRSYGGGVLTFEPTEIGELPLPLLTELSDELFAELDSLVRKKEIRKALDLVDQELLIKKLAYSQSDVNALRKIWEKLSNRRQNRN